MTREEAIELLEECGVRIANTEMRSVAWETIGGVRFSRCQPCQTISAPTANANK